MNNISEKFTEMQQKIRIAQQKVEQERMQGKEDISNSIQTAKGDLAASEENARLWADKTKNAAFTDMLKVKLTLQQKREEFKNKLEHKKFESEKHRKSAEVEFSLELASYLIENALIAIDEATVATLEYIAEALEYDETYGEA